nr:DeoR/GlpR family DNA-binding transcription regulator [Cohnella zeiphila]
MILELLNSKGNVTTAELVRQLDVSKESVRRYMDELESEGKLKKVYGGAIKPEGTREEPPHLERMELHREEKDRVARRAAELVRDGEVIFLDEGTTPLCMIPYLQQRGLTILTNSFPAASLLIDRLNQGRFDGRVVFLGGEIHAKHARCTGVMTVEWMDRHYVDKAFISIDGLDPDSGLTSMNDGKAELSRKAIAHAAEPVVIADASKLGVRFSYKIGELRDIACVVCDQPPPADWKCLLEQQAIRWRTAAD